MRHLPLLSGEEVVRALQRGGFARVSQRGSHVKLRGILTGKTRTVIVPLHHELASGTLRSILRQAGLNPEEFQELLKDI